MALGAGIGAVYGLGTSDFGDARDMVGGVIRGAGIGGLLGGASRLITPAITRSKGIGSYDLSVPGKPKFVNNYEWSMNRSSIVNLTVIKK
jgi:hypothetical protein